MISLWKDPSYIGSYKHLIAGQDIVTPDGMFYYNIARGIANLNYQMFDNITVNTYLDDKPTVKDGFIKRGGYKTVQEIMSLLNIANIDSYYDELVKNNALMDLYDAGFAVVENWDKFSGMECNYDGEMLCDDNMQWYCPNCGNRDTDKMNIIRRTCGYLGENLWCKGRTQEIKERYVHLDNHVMKEE